MICGPCAGLDVGEDLARRRVHPRHRAAEVVRDPHAVERRTATNLGCRPTSYVATSSSPVRGSIRPDGSVVLAHDPDGAVADREAFGRGADVDRRRPPCRSPGRSRETVCHSALETQTPPSPHHRFERNLVRPRSSPCTSLLSGSIRETFRKALLVHGVHHPDRAFAARDADRVVADGDRRPRPPGESGGWRGSAWSRVGAGAPGGGPIRRPAVRGRAPHDGEREQRARTSGSTRGRGWNPLSLEPAYALGPSGRRLIGRAGRRAGCRKWSQTKKITRAKGPPAPIP